MIPIKTITEVERKIKNLSYSHDSRYLAITSESKEVGIYSSDPTDN